MSKERKVLLVFLAILAAITAINGCKDDPVKPVDPPRINSFTATPADIMPGDSSQLSYTVTGADSVKLFPGGIKLTTVTSGQHWTKPATPTTYSLLGYNKSGRDSAAVAVTMSGAVPVIESFGLSEDTLLVGDSAILSWKTIRCDSFVVNNGTAHVADKDSGSVVVKPTSSQTFTAVAYNHIATDTSTAALRIEIPYQISAVNGLYYKGTMGSGITAPPLDFRVLDQQGNSLRRPWLLFSVVDGDGTLSADSARSNSNGVVSNNYLFSGQKGYGQIRAMLRGIDTVDVKARASVIRLGADGQGQFVRFSDAYADVFAWNGSPASIDVDPDYWRNFANYEAALGVVVAIRDVNQNSTIDSNEPVESIILNTVFNRTTPEGIGVGSSIQAVRSAYGTPDSLFYDPTAPPAWGMRYDALGALFYASTNAPDSAIIEIHLWDPTPKVAAGAVSMENFKHGTRLLGSTSSYRK